MPSVAGGDRPHRRRPGPQPRHDRRLHRPRRSGVGRAGASPSRSAARPSCAGPAASGSSRSTASSRGRSRPASTTTRSSSRSGAGPRPTVPASPTASSTQPASGYAIVGVGALIVMPAAATISHAGIGVTGVHEHPYRAKDVEAALVGTDGSEAAIAAAAAHVTDGVDINGDIHADAAYRAAMAVVYTRRAIEARSRPLRPGVLASSVRLERIVAGSPPVRDDLVGAVLARDLVVGGARWSKGRRLSAADLDALGRRALPAPTRSPCSSSSRASSTRTMPRCDSQRRSPGPGLETAARSRAGSTSCAAHDGVAPRPGHRPGAAQPARPARGFHRVRRLDRRGRRPRGERQGRAARRRRESSSTPAPHRAGRRAGRSSASPRSARCASRSS